MSSIATPPPALAQQPATAVLGYGLGDFANSLTLALGVQLLLFYYVDVVGLAPLAVALLLAVVRLWDAVDLPLGPCVKSTTEFMAYGMLINCLVAMGFPRGHRVWEGLDTLPFEREPGEPDA